MQVSKVTHIVLMSFILLNYSFKQNKCKVFLLTVNQVTIHKSELEAQK